MDRRHQVFISSTYDDLKEERHQVIYALLELDCIPAGMELFPASNEDAWSLITTVINDSDYYIVVIGGRYGSCGPDGVSYTEKEYDYAVSINKPVMAFLHEHPGKIHADKTEPTDDGKKRLATFRKKIEDAKHCRYWNTPAEVGGLVSRGLIQMRKKYPSDGWVPGKFAADEAMLRELNDLREKVRQLQDAQRASLKLPEAEVKTLAQGKEKYGWTLTLSLKKPVERKDYPVEVSWNTLFSYAGPSLVGECDDEILKHRLRLAYWHAIPDEMQKRDVNFESIIMPYVVFDQIKTQFRALGLMSSGTKRRSVSDDKVYWAITPYGESLLLKLRARKSETDETLSTPKVAQAKGDVPA